MRKFLDGVGSLITIILLFVAFRFVRIVVILSITALLIVQTIRFNILHAEPLNMNILKGILDDICNKYGINKGIRIIIMDNLSSSINPETRVRVIEFDEEYEIRINIRYNKMYERLFSTLGDFNIIRNTIRMISLYTNKKVPIFPEIMTQMKKLFKPGNN